MEFNKLISDLDSGKISPYQLYNVDMDYPQLFGVLHYKENQKDNIDINQKLQIVFADIEVVAEGSDFDFDKIDEGLHPISCITIFSTYEKVFHVFVLLNKKCVENWNSQTDHIGYFKNKLIELEYLSGDDFDIKLKTYTSDLPLIKDCWLKIHELDPAVISGFNSDRFDLPYIYYRLKRLYNGDTKSVSKIMSKFGEVSISNWGGSRGTVRLIEYVNMDIAYLFRPRADGGLNLGKTLASYSLDFVSDAILKKKKLEYKNKNLTLDQFYEQDPVDYVLYNIIDVTLCVLLDQKLKLIDQYNMYRRLMSSTLSESLRGSTALFDALVLYNLSKDNTAVRYGLTDETIITIDKDEIEKIPKPLSVKDIKWSVNNIDQRTYLKITRKFEGAYVKNSPGQVYDQNDGLIIDLDASLPPWEKIFIRNSQGIFWGEIGQYFWQDGDETLTWDKNNNTCWRKVKGKIEHNWNSDIIKFTTETGKEVCVTDNHSIFAIQQKIKTDTPYLIDAKDLKIGDSIVGYTNFEPNIQNAYSESIGLEKIVSIKKEHYNGPVYDISVEETERFFAGTGIGVHNTSLYPSMIRQCNISFDTFYGRILDPITTEKAIALLDNLFKKKDNTTIKSVYSTFLDLCSKYVESDKITVANKGDTTQQYYYVISYLFNKLINSNAKSIREIFHPKDYYNYILLKKYLIPFLNLVDEISPSNDNPEFNQFCYQYLLNDEFNRASIFVIENINQPYIKISQLLADALPDYLKKNQLILTLTGCLFYKHEKKLSLFAGWLENMYKMRKGYIKERDTFPKGSDEYNFFNSRQLATKIAANTSYGLYGQSTFRYSNNWLAKTITCQGRLSLKISQQVAEDYLKEIK